MPLTLPRTLTLAMQRFSRTNALHTRAVHVHNLMILHAPPLKCAAGLTGGVFEAAEMPVALYLFLKDRGAPLTAIPVFTDRIFVQQYIYTRPDTGIRSIRDLRGRRVAIPKYFITAGLWNRGLLEEEGVDPAEIAWFTTGPEFEPRVTIPPGVSVTIRPGPYLGLQLLLDGSVDCLMTEATPVLPPDRRGDVVRLYADAHGVQRAFFERTACHPIVHLVAVRHEAAQEFPGFLEALCRAFDQAKLSSYRLLQNERVTDLPLMRGYLDDTVETFGADPWPYGLQGRNRAELERVIGYAHRQGLIERALSIDQLFAAETRDYHFEATMQSGAELTGLTALLGELPS